MLAKSISQFLELLDSTEFQEAAANGEIPKEYEELEKILLEDVNQVAEIVLRTEAEAEALNTLADSYYARAKAKSNSLKYLKSLLAFTVKKFGADEYKKDSYSGRWLRGSLVGIKDTTKEICEVTEIESLPKQFKFVDVRIRETNLESVRKKLKELILEEKISVDKKFLNEAFEENKAITGTTAKIVHNVLITGIKKTKEVANG